LPSRQVATWSSSVRPAGAASARIAALGAVCRLLSQPPLAISETAASGALAR
jgi:hypothetical protein